MKTNDIFFVLNGLVNGEDGMYALTLGASERMNDGWYYLPENSEKEDGYGPYESRDDAKRAMIYIENQKWDNKIDEVLGSVFEKFYQSQPGGLTYENVVAFNDKVKEWVYNNRDEESREGLTPPPIPDKVIT